MISIRDFEMVKALSSNGQFSKVNLIKPRLDLRTSFNSGTSKSRRPGRGGGDGLFVVKSLDRAWAFRMRSVSRSHHLHTVLRSQLTLLRSLQQQFPAHEIKILLAARPQDGQPQPQRVPKLVAAFLDTEELHILLEYASGGDLYALLENTSTGAHDEPSGLPESHLRRWMAEAIEALGWLHDKGWAHRSVPVVPFCGLSS